MTQETMGEAGARPLAAMHPVPTGRQPHAASSTAWMVTFTDLVALMLTFFVLLYSMSRLDMVQWQNLANSMSSKLDSVQDSKIVEPKAQLDIAPVRFVPGSDLDYLANVISDRLRNDPVLKSAGFRNEGSRLILTLPDELLFETGSHRPGVPAEQTMFALGGIFRTIGNTVEIVSYPPEIERDPSEETGGRSGKPEAAWVESLGRAIMLASLLSDAGFEGDLRPRGMIRPVSDPVSRAGSTDEATSEHSVEVIVLDIAGER